MRYLNQAWEDRFEHDRLELLGKVCVKTGDRKQLTVIRSRLFQSEQSYASFTRYLEVLDEDETDKAHSSAIKQAEQGGNILSSADLLLNLGQTELSQALVLARRMSERKVFGRVWNHDMPKSAAQRGGGILTILVSISSNF